MFFILTHKDANYAKRDMNLEDFIQLSKEIVENFGYTVTLNGT